MKSCKNRWWIMAIVLPALVIGFCVNSVFAGEEEEEILVITDESSSDQAPFLGIYPADIDDDDREALDYKEGDGVLVEDVVKGEPAEKAGLEAGDIIIKIADDKIGSTKDLGKALKKHKPGDKVNVLFVRDGKEKDVKLELGKRPKIPAIPKIPKMPKMQVRHYENGGYLGIEIAEIKEQLHEYFEVKKGVLIEKVQEGTPAEKAGLKAGDVITKIEDCETSDVNELIESVRKHEPGSEVTVYYVRKGKKNEVKVKLSEAKQTFITKYSDKSNYEEQLIDTEAIRECVIEALENVDIEFEDAEESFREGMEQMKQEMEKMKIELEKMKQEMEAEKKKK
jgi:serine protease Do